eukprot:scaffold535234_cov90-Attheya_sp.AAC.1
MYWSARVFHDTMRKLLSVFGDGASSSPSNGTKRISGMAMLGAISVQSIAKQMNGNKTSSLE